MNEKPSNKTKKSSTPSQKKTREKTLPEGLREFQCPNCMTPGITSNPDPRFDEYACHFCDSVDDD